MSRDDIDAPTLRAPYVPLREEMGVAAPAAPAAPSPPPEWLDARDEQQRVVQIAEMLEHPSPESAERISALRVTTRVYLAAQSLAGLVQAMRPGSVWDYYRWHADENNIVTVVCVGAGAAAGGGVASAVRVTRLPR
jgi:hypothetical protein